MTRNTAKRSARSGDRAECGPKEEIAHLGDLSREQLIQIWNKTHGRPPPKGVSRRLLELSAAYALQAKASGGLKPNLRNALAAALEPSPAPLKSKAKAAPLKPGSQLVRVWNGRTHHVEVVESGFVWNGERFRSLVPSPARSPARAGQVRGSSAYDQDLAPLRRLYPQVHRGGPRSGLQLSRCPARGLCGLHQIPGKSRLEVGRQVL